MSKVNTPSQLFLGLTEAANERLETLLAQGTCTYHKGTTLDLKGSCAMCDLQFADSISHQPEWVRRARQRTLPAKTFTTN